MNYKTITTYTTEEKMRKLFTEIFIISFTFAGLIFGQNVINVPPVTNTGGNIDALYNAVTSASDGDILVLERGGIYLNTNEINIQKNITIKGAEGDGALPKLIFSNANISYPKLLRPSAKICVIKDIEIDGGQDTQPTSGYGIHLDGPAQKMIVDGVVFNHLQYGIRTKANVDTAIVQNCKFINLEGQEASAGRVIDWRNNRFNKIVMQNNTIVFAQGFVFQREGWDGFIEAPNQIDEFIADHNTVINVWGTWGAPNQFDRVEYVQVSNNLLVNMRLAGNDQISADFLGYLENLDTIKDPRVISILGEKGFWLFAAECTDSANTQIVMQNNNIYNTADLVAEWNKSSKVSAPHIWTNQFASVLKDTIAPAFAEPLEFTKGPKTPTNLVSIIVTNIDTMSAGGDAFAGVHPYDGTQANFEEVDLATLDLSYSTGSASYTKATGGFPLGDLNWFPAKKAEWLAAGSPTGIKKEDLDIPSTYKLSQNYPNPFNPSTVISFSIPNASITKLSVYNILGQEVATLVNKELSAGSYKFEFNANSLTSGIYFYKLQSNNYSQVKKMMLIK